MQKKYESDGPGACPPPLSLKFCIQMVQSGGGGYSECSKLLYYQPNNNNFKDNSPWQ